MLVIVVSMASSSAKALPDTLREVPKNKGF
jgi:hypothetical protein